jgi:hypothetical protein
MAIFAEAIILFSVDRCFTGFASCNIYSSFPMQDPKARPGFEAIRLSVEFMISGLSAVSRITHYSDDCYFTAGIWCCDGVLHTPLVCYITSLSISRSTGFTNLFGELFVTHKLLQMDTALHRVVQASDRLHDPGDYWHIIH